MGGITLDFLEAISLGICIGIFTPCRRRLESLRSGKDGVKQPRATASEISEQGADVRMGVIKCTVDDKAECDLEVELL